MSKQKEKQNPYMTISECVARHTALSHEIEQLSNECTQIRNALVGEDMQGGLVATVREIKTKVDNFSHRSLRGRDWVAIAIAIITSITAIAVAYLK